MLPEEMLGILVGLGGGGGREEKLHRVCLSPIQHPYSLLSLRTRANTDTKCRHNSSSISRMGKGACVKVLQKAMSER